MLNVKARTKYYGQGWVKSVSKINAKGEGWVILLRTELKIGIELKQSH
jgi:hypothetical protein